MTMGYHGEAIPFVQRLHLKIDGADNDDFFCFSRCNILLTNHDDIDFGKWEIHLCGHSINVNGAIIHSMRCCSGIPENLIPNLVYPGFSDGTLRLV